MQIDKRKIAQIVWLAGAGIWIGHELWDVYQDRSVDRKIAKKTKDELAAVDYASGILAQEIEAGRYADKSVADIENDFNDLRLLYDPRNK